MTQWAVMLGALVLAGCCAIGPEDHPDGVMDYAGECLAFMKHN